MGHFRIGLQRHRRSSELSIPGLWRARPGIQAGAGRGSGDRPYASALALMVAPEEACLNLRAADRGGLRGKISASMKPSITRLRGCPAANRSAVVRSFMAHHQGMSFLSLAYLLLDRPMQKRFESDPSFQATMLLLQERIPKATTFYVRMPTKSPDHDQLPACRRHRCASSTALIHRYQKCSCCRMAGIM